MCFPFTFANFVRHKKWWHVIILAAIQLPTQCEIVEVAMYAMANGEQEVVGLNSVYIYAHFEMYTLNGCDRVISLHKLHI